MLWKLEVNGVGRTEERYLKMVAFSTIGWFQGFEETDWKEGPRTEKRLGW